MNIEIRKSLSVLELSALGVEACRQTYRVLYIRIPDLMRNFENQSDNTADTKRR